MSSVYDPPAKKARDFKATARINSKLAVQAHKRGDTKERDFQLSMRKYNKAEAGRNFDEFGRGVRSALKRKGTR